MLIIITCSRAMLAAHARARTDGLSVPELVTSEAVHHFEIGVRALWCFRENSPPTLLKTSAGR